MKFRASMYHLMRMLQETEPSQQAAAVYSRDCLDILYFLYFCLDKPTDPNAACQTKTS